MESASFSEYIIWNSNFINSAYLHTNLSVGVLTLQANLFLTALEVQVYYCNLQPLFSDQLWFLNRTVAPFVGVLKI